MPGTGPVPHAPGFKPGTAKGQPLQRRSSAEEQQVQTGPEAGAGDWAPRPEPPADRVGERLRVLVTPSPCPTRPSWATDPDTEVPVHLPVLLHLTPAPGPRWPLNTSQCPAPPSLLPPGLCSATAALQKGGRRPQSPHPLWTLPPRTWKPHKPRGALAHGHTWAGSSVHTALGPLQTRVIPSRAQPKPPAPARHDRPPGSSCSPGGC